MGKKKNFKEYNLTMVMNMEVSKDNAVGTELYVVGCFGQWD